MNIASLAGRLARDPDIRYTSESQKAVARFTLAVDRFTKGGEKTADFIRCVAFDKAAENIEKYIHKGDQIMIEGAIRTGSYQNKDGETVFTTDVYVNRLEFGKKAAGGDEERREPKAESFEEVEKDLPF